MTKFFKLLFLSTLALGSMISISSVSWFCSWIGLEINLLSFITLMKTPNNKYSTESISKYFLTQTMASFILLFSIILYTNSKEFNFDLNSMSSIFMSSAVFMKMGAAPLHFWFPEVASGISWNSNLILLTWQKIAPMILISYMNILPNLMIMFIVSSSIIGSLMGLNQTCLRKIMSYSSINHMSWMISTTLCSMNTWLFYFLIYSLMNLVIINTFKMWKINFISQINSIKNNTSKIMFMMNLFSLGGLPPFSGFVPKWLTINQLSYNSMFFLTFTMVIFTLITLFFYLRISFSSLTLFSNNSMISKSKNNLTMSMIILTILPMLMTTALLLL
uniref:NADH-ubiquinone oxidoreductase chain 2 n=1 Tax=Xylosandrus sp. TaxID=2995405 RepID=A0A9E8G363_9CUCU|nr:NADH dehydrogenase subunit 2 [Xylosandrus sp.]